MRAVISVSDKRGVVDFARALSELGYELVSTGGTKRSLSEAGIAVRGVSEITGFPEILDGRVKTLHPAIHGGILARKDQPADLATLAEQGIAAIDLVVVNLYPFVETVARAGVTLAEALENIDIGGPTMVRAAAKNHPAVLVVVDPSDYEQVLSHLRAGSVSAELRRKLAAKAFAHTAAYDSAIARYLEDEPLPTTLTLPWHKAQGLRYGENPHQEAAFYRDARLARGTLAAARQLQGKELSYNNLLDADAALQVVRAYDEPTVAIIKHTNPCGLASNDDLTVAHREARSGDPVSAFGGIVGLNRPLDGRLAEALKKYFYEVIIAPGFSTEALAILADKQNLRLLEVDASPDDEAAWEYRSLSGGLLVQRADRLSGDEPSQWRAVTSRAPSEDELTALWFAWRACAFVKSNAIVLARGRTLVGMGAGQPSRVDSVQIAARKAGERAAGSVLASDAFFPKPDGVEAAAAAGASAIVQPGGSIADEEVIAAADRLGLAMVFTGRRHFKH